MIKIIFSTTRDNITMPLTTKNCVSGLGGYVHEDGQKVVENSYMLSRKKLDLKFVESIRQKYNQESVLIVQKNRGYLFFGLDRKLLFLGYKTKASSDDANWSIFNGQKFTFK